VTAPLGPDPLHAVLDAACGIDGADEVEAWASHRWGGLTRFARSSIHQHVESEDTTVSVRAVVGGRVGVGSTNTATPAGAEAAARRALEAALRTPPEPDFPGLAGPSTPPAVTGRYDEATAGARPDQRAAAVAALLATLRPGQEGAGAVATSADERALVTSRGARLYGAWTRAEGSTVVMGGGASGHAEDAASALAALDPADLGERAATTCAAAVDPGDATPGDHEVVLLPSAVATLLDFLAFTAFNGKAFHEGRSAFSGRLGEQVAAPIVTIADDVLGPGAIGLPWDHEGTPTQRVELIRRGVASAVVHDRASGAATGSASTGHGLPAPGTWGPMPLHMVLEPGDASVDDLIAGVDEGLLVTRFWYTRVVHPIRTLVTGMTRDGTFRIEGGERAGPVRNLRYNQSILEALATCDGIGAVLRSCCDEGGDTRVPAIRLRSFRFSSSSDH
jgi:predicted Zn-dependent protease